jgi:hypothetical protein
MIVGGVLIIIGPFEHKFVLLLLLPVALLVGVVLRGEYRRGVRAMDAVRDKYLPLEEKRIKAAQILADWRGARPADVRGAVDAVQDDDIRGVGPVEIACMAVRYLDVPE